MEENKSLLQKHFTFNAINWLPNWQFKNKEVLYYFKGLSEDGGNAKFSENLRATPFQKDLSNETTLA